MMISASILNRQQLHGWFWCGGPRDWAGVLGRLVATSYHHRSAARPCAFLLGPPRRLPAWAKSREASIGRYISIITIVVLRDSSVVLAKHYGCSSSWSLLYVGSTYTMGSASPSVACAPCAVKSCPLMTLRMRRYGWASVLLVARQHSLVQLCRFDPGLSVMMVMMSTTAAFGITALPGAHLHRWCTLKVQVVPDL
jgi:hypothetical protein